MEYPLACHFINKWGPCTRTILDILSAPPHARDGVEGAAELSAEAAARAICADPGSFRFLTVLPQPQSVGSTILFIKPRFPLRVKKYTPDFDPFIPTAYLADILNLERLKLSDDDAWELFAVLSPHAQTRAGAGWVFERHVHSSLCCQSAPLTIFRGDESKTIRPSRQLLAGTIGALAHVKAYPSFYWIPSQANFPGIDGVLADDKNIYAVQATIAEEHRNPMDGLRKIWRNFERDVRMERAWHLVVIAADESLARDYANHFAQTVEASPLRAGTHATATKSVKVWGCVLPAPTVPPTISH